MRTRSTGAGTHSTPAPCAPSTPNIASATTIPFSFLDSRKLSTLEQAAGELTEEGPSLLDDVAAGELPSVGWIDPCFKDLRVLGPDSNSGHPPSDVIAGQELVPTIYHALSSAQT